MTEDCRYCTARSPSVTRTSATAPPHTSGPSSGGLTRGWRHESEIEWVLGALYRLLGPFDRQDAPVVSSMRLPFGAGLVFA